MMAESIDDILYKDEIREILGEINDDIDDILGIVLVYSTKSGSIKWKRSNRRSEALGLLDICHHDMLIEDDD